MKILTAGGTYINTETTEGLEPVGGFKIAGLIGEHSRHAVYLHTNFSTEESRITAAIKRSLRENGVDPRYAGAVSEAYGRIGRDTFESGSNLYETVRSDSRMRKRLAEFSLFVLTTDMAQRDFKYLLAFAKNSRIPALVFTCGEYPVQDDPRVTVHALHKASDEINPEAPVRPVYHEKMDEIKTILIEHGIIESAPVERTFKEQPKTPLHDTGRFLVQIAALALFAALIVGGAIFLLQQFSGPGAEYETAIDPAQLVDHLDCQTVADCTALGDEYLDELNAYIDIHDEPHMFIENRSRTGYITYTIEDFELTDPQYDNELPFGEEEEFEEIWERFTAIIPPERITSVNQFNLFSDGEGNTLAYVDIQPHPVGTTLGVDIRDNPGRASQFRTLIHEYGHIHSLPAEDFEAGCGGTELDCLKDDTLMNDYIERFWAQYGEEWLENKFKSQPEREAFYTSNINDFYVPYQATNPKEDYAVTFVSFITAPMPPGDDQLNDVKVRSFYEDPDLVALRVDILKNLLTYEKERTS